MVLVTRRIYVLLAFVVGIAFGVWTERASWPADSLRPAVMEACPEDSVLVGEGQYSEGRWTRYVCGPARDDYVEGGE